MTRSEVLRERYPFAAEMLTLYDALQAVHITAPPIPNAAALATYAAEHIMPQVIDTTIAHGPELLAAAVGERWAKGNLVEICARWLADDEITAVDRYLARASLQPLLESLHGAPELWHTVSDNEGRCPLCAGAPQLAYFEVSGEALVTGSRRLLCSRCSHAWTVQRVSCANCVEDSSQYLHVFGEKETFPHMRVDACDRCKRYLITVDLKADPRAVPEIDELAALPLDIYAAERGFTKIVPNLMGN